jgi:Cu2+-exporting ATPase
MFSRALPSAPAAARPACSHCGQPIPPSRSDGFCCAGCLAVNRLLAQEGMASGYYQLRPQRIQPLLGYFDRRPSLDWLDRAPGLAAGKLELNVEGLQCGACVWAIERVAQKHGGARVGVNTALGRLSLGFDPAHFDAKRYLQAVAELGYRVRPIDEALEDRSRPLLLRLGVSAAVAMNAMSYSLPVYFGLAEDGSGLIQALRNLNLGLTVIAVAYGGSYFFGRAWASLKQGVAHFDIPIAIGILAAFGGSLWAHWQGDADSVYYDSVNVFLSFMLAGRFIQERALLRNRRQLLKAEAFQHSLVTVLDPAPHEVRYPEVDTGMRLLLQPGSLCPAEAVLDEPGPVEFDRASVTGEAAPVGVLRGGSIPAGARLVGSRPARLRAAAPFSAGLLARLAPSSLGEEELPVVWRWSVKYYVAFVLIAAFGALGYWLWRDPSVAARAFIATLVVTCPCGLGIAAPLARTLADRRLASAGLLLRQPGLLERLHGVKRVWLDKTGTLTFSQLQLADPAALRALEPAQRRALMGASAASRHPVSRALFRELSAQGEPWPEGGQAEEIPGQGVRWKDAAGDWFLGRSMAAAPGAGPPQAVLSLGGEPQVSFDLHEQLLSDAAPSLQALRERGLSVGLLSGDHASRVGALAAQLGVEPQEARAGQSPEQKLAAVREAPALMLGDGLNDAQALGAASASGAPAWERSVVADRADFSFGGASLAWLPELFATRDALRRTLWGNLRFTAIYNLAVVSVTVQGLFSPLLCAVLMPGSSLLVMGLTLRSMAKR